MQSLRNTFTLVVLAGLLAFALPASALRIHYDVHRNSQLRACDQLAEQGSRDEAKACFEALLEAPEPLTRAEAAHSLGQVKQANRWFREAAEASNDPYIKTRWGYLYLTTHQISDAAALFRESLEADPQNVPATLGLAEAQGRQFQGQARQALYEIIRKDSEQLHALVLLVRTELELQRLDQAEGLLDAALALAIRQNRSPLEIYALYASLDLLRGNPDSEATEKALALNPSYGEIYAIPAHFYIITYRYREAVELYQKAIDIAPEFADGHSKLGINMLRTNNLFGARFHMKRAYELDPFNTETVNTLRLLDDMDDMRVSFLDVMDETGEEKVGRIFTRLDREDIDALQPYVESLSADAVRLFTERYDFKLKKPVVVELYHNHDDFGVRTVSTPGIGLLGVTFGYVLAMDSPKARPTGDFHWGSTLWHELVHVFTLEAANHLLPRWYSEGLSVYEEWRTGPLPSREIPAQVLRKLQSNEFLPIADLDSGFVRPTYEGQVNVSYMQAGLTCLYIAENWGHQALVNILKSFAEGKSTSEAIRQHLYMDDKAFDESFLVAIRIRYKELLEHFDEWSRIPQLLSNATGREDWDMVNLLADRMIELYPEYISEGNAYQFKAMALREQDKPAEARSVLLEWHSRGGQDVMQLRELARELDEEGQIEDSVSVLESINWISPYFVEEHQLLGDHYLAQQEPDLALREFSALIGASPDQNSSGWLGKARAWQQHGEKDKALRSVLMALESAPFYREAQHLLLNLVTGESVD